MANDYTARKQSGWKVVSTAPDVCKTPMGSSTPPVPYPVTSELSQTSKPAGTVFANGNPLVLFDASLTPKTLGDAAGTAKGIKSGTVGAACWPKARSGTVRVEGKRIVRHDDEFWMNGSYGGKWTIAEVLKILCPQDKAVVDDLAQTDVEVADEIYYDDPYHDGTQWTTRRFNGGGSWNGETLLALTQGSAQNAATTMYHELVHKHQDAGMPWRDKEVDAYYRTEEWTIERGLPSQGGPELRTIGAEGAVIPNREGIVGMVNREYPLPSASSGPSDPVPVGKTPTGDTILSDGTTRPPQAGDTFAGPEETTNKRKVPRSVWKCPGEGAGKQGGK